MRLLTEAPPAGRSDHPIFDGEVLMRALLDAERSDQNNVAEVTFRAGGRTKWHAHDTDQLLVVLAGEGVVVNEGERIAIRAGDVVLVGAGERHWHGSDGTSTMTHLSILTPGEDHVQESVADG